MSKTTDSPRWCDTHQTWGDHHTDRCPDTFDPSPEAAERAMVEQARRLAPYNAARATPAVPAPRRGLAKIFRRR